MSLMPAQHAACLCSQFVAGMRGAAHWRVFRGGPGLGLLWCGVVGRLGAANGWIHE